MSTKFTPLNFFAWTQCHRPELEPLSDVFSVILPDKSILPAVKKNHF
jgi:hypothetical protein